MMANPARINGRNEGRNEAHETCLVGTLETWPMEDVLLWLHISQRTAMLRVGAGLDAAVVFFKEGQLYRAEWGQMMGEQAVLALLELKAGSFALIQREVPCPRPNIATPTAELLLQCAISRDERGRAQLA